LPPEDAVTASLVAELDLLRGERALLYELLAADTRTLSAFVGHAARATARVRSLLRQRAADPVVYQRKLVRMQEIYARLALRAAAVPLPTLASQYEHTARTIAAAGASAVPSGDALLPALPLIDEGFVTLATLAARVGRSLPGSLRRSRPARRQERAARALPAAPAGMPRLVPALQELGERLAAEHGKRITLSMLGFEQLPEGYTGAIYDILCQLLRNAIEHGVESPARRSEAGKDASGALLVECQLRTGGQIELSFQDDGQGLQPERILRAGIERGLVPASESLPHDTREASTLIFYAGLSTAENPAGRGQGMCIVRDQVRRLHGQIQIATKRGQFTRIRIRLPAHIAEEKPVVARHA